MPDHVDPAPSLKETVDNADNSASSATNSPFSTMEEALGPQEGGDGGIRRSRRVPVTVLWAVAVVVIVVDQIGLGEGDFIDIGEPLFEGRVVPVSVKTLVFYQ